MAEVGLEEVVVEKAPEPFVSRSSELGMADVQQVTEPGSSVESLAGVVRATSCYNKLRENDLVRSHDVIVLVATKACV